MAGCFSCGKRQSIMEESNMDDAYDELFQNDSNGGDIEIAEHEPDQSSNSVVQISPDQTTETHLKPNNGPENVKHTDNELFQVTNAQSPKADAAVNIFGESKSDEQIKEETISLAKKRAEMFSQAAYHGQKFLKYGRQGKPHYRTVSVKAHQGELHCLVIDYSSGKMKVSHDKQPQVLRGKNTSVFSRDIAQDADPNNCFSIVTLERSLDLVAPNSTVRDLWANGLELYFMSLKPHPSLGNQKDNSGATNTAHLAIENSGNSPSKSVSQEEHNDSKREDNVTEAQEVNTQSAHTITTLSVPDQQIVSDYQDSDGGQNDEVGEKQEQQQQHQKEEGKVMKATKYRMNCKVEEESSKNV